MKVDFIVQWRHVDVKRKFWGTRITFRREAPIGGMLKLSWTLN